jgi:hypothetical protein
MSLTLELPIDNKPDDFYKSTTPEENLVLMLTGITIIKKLRETQYETRIENLRRDLERERNSHAELRRSFESAIQGCFQREAQNLVSSIDKRFMLESSKIVTRNDEPEKKPAYNSTRGRINEENSHQIIIDCFSSPDFRMHAKEYFSGDHVFDWNGLRIMWEDKNYQKIVPLDQVEKAYRDFDMNKDCDILLMVSLNTNISTHETSTRIDVEIIDDRLAIFVSKFGENDDCRQYVKTVLQPIILAYKPFLMRRKNEMSDTNFEKLRIFRTSVPQFLGIIASQEKIMNELSSDVSTKLTSVKKSLTGARNSILSIVQENEVCNMDVTAVTKKERKCGMCGYTGHDARNCPKK